jgi:hypothetical protein
MPTRLRRFSAILICSLFFFAGTSFAESPGADQAIGRWDLEVEGPNGVYPSWIEIRKSGYSTLVGSFVGQFGSSRPISEIVNRDGEYRFEIPPQWEQRKRNLVFEFKIDGESVAGVTTAAEGDGLLKFKGTRAPALKRSGEPKWGTPLELFNGENLEGWSTQLKDVKNGWVVKDDLLFNKTPGNNLVSNRKFNDFKLHAEFRYPKGSNSGLYLRGRYEVQIEDNYGKEPECHKIGGVYGFLTPSTNAARKPGEWQEYDVTLIGRTVTVVLNGERVIDRQAIPGITGGAIDSLEGEAGPILIQGDHGPIEFRKLTITPAE